MANARVQVTLDAQTDDWENLTELVAALLEYVPRDSASVYQAVQQIAEGELAQLDISQDQLAEFSAHMAEFRIDVLARKS